MTQIFVQFADASEKTVVAVFGCPQDATAYPNQAQIDSADLRYLAFINAAWQTYQARAQAALSESDMTILRCYENAVVVPAAWATYRKALRTIVSTASGDATQPFPTMPAYPAGT
ncbi:hypothetical protein [Ralstonia solanacearum]|uniref:hypothetical protein n=1 Tax=Ralstonia solanacearum TaxID=305 RepID=UPI003D80803C